MAGTNIKRNLLCSRPAIILRNPQLPENIGMAARSMLNYGFSDLRIVNPKITWPNIKSINSSAGAFETISKTTKLYNKLGDSFDSIDVLFALSVRTRDLEIKTLSPKKAIEKIKLKYNNKKIGFLFGPEKAGLDNNDLSEANYIIKIPTNPGFGSLNLAMAVNIICYEWYTKNNDYVFSEDTLASANKRNISHFKRFLIKSLYEIEFFNNNETDSKLETNLKNIFSKLLFTEKELLILYGVVKALKNYKNK